MILFMSGTLDNWYGSQVKETWEDQKKKTDLMMISDIKKSIEIDKGEMEIPNKKKHIFSKQSPDRNEPFSFEDLVQSAKETIWIGEIDLRILCAKALFESLNPKDYRYGNWELFSEELRTNL